MLFPKYLLAYTEVILYLCKALFCAIIYEYATLFGIHTFCKKDRVEINTHISKGREIEVLRG